MAALLGVLGGCSSPRYYEDVPEPTAPAPVQAPAATDEWVVKSGDTLYSIAFSAGLDWRDLAAGNGISPPYTIYPGQRLRLGGGPLAQAASQDPDAPDAGADPTGPVRTHAAPESGPGLTTSSAPPALATPTAPATPAATPPSATADSPGSVPPIARSTPPAVPSSAPPPAPRVVKNGAWQWPADGKLMRGFAAGAQPHKGIDIAGAIGDPVYAANGGTVVYAGSGVRGYGNLLIVKHDAQYLSAYAHNSRLLVKEGDVVSGGQRIAEIGDSGADRVKLHFELRRQGNPVDPLKVLPKR